MPGARQPVLAPVHVGKRSSERAASPDARSSCRQPPLSQSAPVQGRLRPPESQPWSRGDVDCDLPKVSHGRAVMWSCGTVCFRDFP